ncbi:MAG: carbamate kinase, partial [Acidocella sp. 35-58-6]
MRILVALGGNALLRRGEALSTASQQASIEIAAGLLAHEVFAGHHIIITHGNGPQVGLLALQSAAGPPESTMPLDVLDAESEGWIGYTIELALRNALPEGAIVVTLLTQVLVDSDDKAFKAPNKPIGPVYDEATAKHLANQNHWSVQPDGKFWRRVVASPNPMEIVEIASIKRLIDTGAIIICGGGGGIPVRRLEDGKLAGIEAVIDKDATSALLAEQVGADMFIMLSDVPGVYLDYGSKAQRLITTADPVTMDGYAPSFAAGSMGPKVAAACAFVRAT